VTAVTHAVGNAERSFLPPRNARPPGGDLHPKIEALIPRLTRYARALTRDLVAADDLVQEALSRALEKIHLWQEGTDLRAWLFTILHHHYVSQLRRSAREGAHVELRDCDQLLTLAPSQGQRLELRDLERAIAALPETQRSVILLVGLEGMGYDEVASMMKLPIGTVRSRVSRGREALRVRTGLGPTRARPPHRCETTRTVPHKPSMPH
jgi:RNA polymerase sigma-70 factor (ECF subfamily)